MLNSRGNWSHGAYVVHQGIQIERTHSGKKRIHLFFGVQIKFTLCAIVTQDPLRFRSLRRKISPLLKRIFLVVTKIQIYKKMLKRLFSCY